MDDRICQLKGEMNAVLAACECATKGKLHRAGQLLRAVHESAHAPLLRVLEQLGRLALVKRWIDLTQPPMRREIVDLVSIVDGTTPLPIQLCIPGAAEALAVRRLIGTLEEVLDYGLTERTEGTVKSVIHFGRLTFGLLEESVASTRTRKRR